MVPPPLVFAPVVAAGAHHAVGFSPLLRRGTSRLSLAATSMPPRRASLRVAAAVSAAVAPPSGDDRPPLPKRRARSVRAPAAAAAADAAADAVEAAAPAAAAATPPVADGRTCCRWLSGAKAVEVAYHDTEWGRPPRAVLPPPPPGVSMTAAVDRHLFEMITLEGAQAGLSWSTILAKRDGYRAAFAHFDPVAVAAMTAADEAALVAGPPTIVRHKGKVASTVNNAAAFAAVADEYGSFDAYLHDFFCGPNASTDYPPAAAISATGAQPPASTPASSRLAADLKRRGFRFFGPTTAYAFMQAVGVVNDHDIECHCWAAAEAAVKAWRTGGGGGVRDS
ncbi:hypothetical protein MMPV_005343 [Pyropia vietnamensis]